MHLLFHLLHPGTTTVPGHQPDPQQHEIVPLPKDENTSEGGEFLDDALRMEDMDTVPTA
jgi:hypothetical protein